VQKKALAVEKVNGLLKPFRSLLTNKTSIAVAVSGGADSMALCLLIADWAKKNEHKIVALTVDHGLREDGAKEALKVSNWLKIWGISHKILSWDGKKPITGIQSAARNARYTLMMRWCRKKKIRVLMTAHHLEDQVETFLLRAERGSGLDGLASMSSVVDLEGVMLIRPLLVVSKSFLRRFLIERQQVWIEDPSNNSLVFQRTIIRRLVERLEQRGLFPPTILELINHFADLRRQFSEIVDVFFERAVRILPESYGVVHLEALKSLPDPVLERVLVQIISKLSGNVYPPRRERIKHSMRKIKSFETSNFTLGRCRFIFKGSKVIVCRDQRSITTKKVVAGDGFNWDGLFDVKISGPREVAGKLGALGKKGWIQIVEKCPELKNIPIPHPVRATLPTLFDGDTVVEVPSLEYRCRDKDKLILSIINPTADQRSCVKINYR
jgi:tRNA(Ile)-lysidine synthase